MRGRLHDIVIARIVEFCIRGIKNETNDIRSDGVTLLVSLEKKRNQSYFVCRSCKNDMSVSTSQVAQDGLIGTWHDDNEGIQIKEDGILMIII